MTTKRGTNEWRGSGRFIEADDSWQNSLDPLEGDSAPIEPQNSPTLAFPSGDLIPGGDFVARFTIDTRPEVGVWAAGSVWVDINGNETIDSRNPDFVNRDIIYTFGSGNAKLGDRALSSDDFFAGNFVPNAGGTAEGFDKLGVYGSVGQTIAGPWRWLIDTDNDGIPNFNHANPANIDGLPVAGNFDGNVNNGDEVGLFDGTSFWLDTDHTFTVDTQIVTPLRGLPIVGDFDGDGLDDLGTWNDDEFQFDLAKGGFGDLDAVINFGFIGVRERPMATDMNQDGIDDIGVWTPDRAGVTPEPGAEWYFLVSNEINVAGNKDGYAAGAEDFAPGTHTFMPSIAVNALGDMAIGFACSADTTLTTSLQTPGTPPEHLERISNVIAELSGLRILPAVPGDAQAQKEFTERMAKAAVKRDDNVPDDQDSDGDGLPDSTDPYPNNRDGDRDGMSDYLEILLGRNPKDPSDGRSFAAQLPTDGEDVAGAPVAKIGQSYWAGVQDIDGFTLELIPDVVTELPSVANGGITINDDGTETVRYQIRDEAVWADGTPISGDDFAFTYQTITDPDLPIDKTIYEDIDPESVVAGPKTFEYTLTQPTVQAELIFGTILPKRDVEPSVQDGDSVVFRFIPETASLINAFKAREVDITNPPPSIETIEDLQTLEAEGESAEVLSGPIWRHLNFQFGENRFDQNEFSMNEFLLYRKAVAHAIDKVKIVDEILKGQVEPLDSYVDAFSPTLSQGSWAHYDYNPVKAVALVAELTKGPDPSGQDGIPKPDTNGDGVPDDQDRDTDGDKVPDWAEREIGSHPGRFTDFPRPWRKMLAAKRAARTSIVLGGGDPTENCGIEGERTVETDARVTLSQLFISMFEDAGMEYEAQPEDSSLFFGETLDFGGWEDLGEWAWVGTPGFAGLVAIHDVFDPEAPPPDGSNFYRWGTPEVTAADPTVDETDLVALINEMENILADNVVIIPLYARLDPGAVWADEVGDYMHKPSQAGDTWNMEEWYRGGEKKAKKVAEKTCPSPKISYNNLTGFNLRRNEDGSFTFIKTLTQFWYWLLSAERNDMLSTNDGQSELARVGLTRELHERIVAKDKDNNRPIVVAIIDSGVDLSHPELWGQLWRNKREIPFNRVDDDRNGYVDDVYGYNTFADNSNVWDDNGHGTAVAGILAARWDERGVAGVAPNCQLMVLKAFNKEGQSDSVRVALAIRYAVLNGANIIHISAENERPHELDQAMIDWATENGVLVVAAAGSSGRDTAKVTPAGLRGVLTVGAVDQDDRRSKFSGWGRHVDLVAPGTDILSLRAHGTDFMFTMAGQSLGINERERIVDERWYRADGTSFSAPLVTGVAAALWAKNPELTAEQIKNKLIMSCDDVERPGWDILTGAGRLNAAKALDADPDQFLMTKVLTAELQSLDGQRGLAIYGEADGTHFRRRWLQIAYGEDASRADWQTIQFSEQPVRDGVLGFIDGLSLDRSGTWSVRSIVEDTKGTVRQSVVTFDIQ